ncbi:MAG: DUF1223 domain-containing protein [Myxococcota bacterium]
MSLLVVLAACGSTSIPNEHSFVALELFTSQSCSSCPPADDDLNAIAARQRDGGTREFALAWHVDYWNNLGWRDPYSTAAASERQFAYVDALRTSRYTPQMVANGQEDFVGGNDSARAPAIARFLSEPSPVSIHLLPDAAEGGELVVGVEVTGAPEGAELLVALLHSGIVTEIPSGENAGKTLAYDNVVRSFVQVPTDAGEVILPVPDDVPAGGASVAALVQRVDGLEVVGAELVDVP